MTLLADDALARLKAAADEPQIEGARYIGLQPIGRGGMGSVFRATDTLLGRDVAIKVAHLAAATAPAIDADRLHQEARILARLDHPGIVPVHDAGLTTDGRTFYAMKLVRGRSLGAFLAAETELSARLSAFERLVDVMASAHANGVIHRDLSPSNVMVGAFGEVLVLDWGVARDIRPVDTEAVRVGTPGFAAPELGSGAGSPASDVYSLGRILLIMCADRPPAVVPKRLRAIAAKCTATDPESRYADAAALALDLAALRASRPVTAYRDTWMDALSAWWLRYGAFATLIAAYLLMRAAFAFAQRGRLGS